MGDQRTIATARLDLPVWEADAIQALIDQDGTRLAALTGAVWPQPLAPPPLMGDALAFFAERLRQDPALGRWWARLVVVRAAAAAVGSAGLSGRPDGEGAVTVGYALYPVFQGNGYASEAVRGIVGWALTRPGVARVRATIPPGNEPSRRVAAKAGLRRVGTDWDEEAGEVEVWETGAADRAAP